MIRTRATLIILAAAGRNPADITRPTQGSAGSDDVLDAIVVGLRELPSVELIELPHMADCAEWG